MLLLLFHLEHWVWHPQTRFLRKMIAIVEMGGLNNVDFWFSNEDRDKMLVQKMDEEDGFSASSAE